jgi:NADH dehydrogenase
MENHQELNVVTGAFGYTGQCIARRLLQRGIAIRTLTGHPRRANPLGDSVEAVPFNFDRPSALAESLRGATTVFNTYWIRFERGGVTFDRAVQNIRTLIGTAREAGVRRIVQISITNASAASPLPYFRGKGLVEDTLRESGLSYAIVRPAIIFGPEDILINNIAWTVRKFPIFFTPGNGQYRVQPIFVEDLAELAVSAAEEAQNIEFDAVGPEIFTFDELVRLLASTVGKKARIVHVPPAIALLCAAVLGQLMGDVMLTADEIRGLIANLLVSHDQPTAPTRLSDWLMRNAAQVGLYYASELAKRA